MSANCINEFIKTPLLKKVMKNSLKKMLNIAFWLALIGVPYIYLLNFFLNSSPKGYEMDANAYLYTLSTISQTIAALIGLFGIFVILKLEDFRKERVIIGKNEISSLVSPFVFGILAIVFSLMFLPFSNLKLNEIDFLSSIGLTPLEVVGFALFLCFSAIFFMIQLIYTIFMDEMKRLRKEGQIKPK